MSHWQKLTSTCIQMTSPNHLSLISKHITETSWSLNCFWYCFFFLIYFMFLWCQHSNLKSYMWWIYAVLYSYIPSPVFSLPLFFNFFRISLSCANSLEFALWAQQVLNSLFFSFSLLSIWHNSTEPTGWASFIYKCKFIHTDFKSQ